MNRRHAHRPRHGLNELAFLILGALILLAATIAGPAPAQGASGRVIPSRAPASPTPTSVIPCLPPGVEPGDVFGPGPLDVYPDVPPCPRLTLPPTDVAG